MIQCGRGPKSIKTTMIYSHITEVSTARARVYEVDSRPCGFPRSRRWLSFPRSSRTCAGAVGVVRRIVANVAAAQVGSGGVSKTPLEKARATFSSGV